MASVVRKIFSCYRAKVHDRDSLNDHEVVGQIIQRMPPDHDVPMAAMLLREFNKSAGVFHVLPADENDAIGDYTDSVPPRIRLSKEAGASTLVHELRHHHQNLTLGHLYRPKNVNEYIAVRTFIEADARAVEALDLMERFEAFFRTPAGKDLVDDEKAQQRAYQSILRDADFYNKRLYDFHRLFSKMADGKYTLQADEKRRVMRDVFDAFVRECRDPDQYYRLLHKKHVSRLSATPYDCLYVPLITLLGGTAILFYHQPTVVLAGTLATVAGIMGGLFNYGMRRTFNKFSGADRQKMAEVLTQLGDLPDGQGNYMTQTTGPGLASDFYYEMPQDLGGLIEAKRKEMRLAHVPFAGTISAARACFLGYLPVKPG